MADVKLIGEDDDPESIKYVTATVALQRFAGVAGVANSIRTKAGGAGQIKVALYDDSGGVPLNRLASPSASAVTSGWNIIPISPVNVSVGYYWIAVAPYSGDGSALHRVVDYGGGQTGLKKEIASWESFAWPDPFSSVGYTSNNYQIFMVAVWGTLASGGAGRLIGVGDPNMITVGHPKRISAGLSPGLIRGQ